MIFLFNWGDFLKVPCSFSGVFLCFFQALWLLVLFGSVPTNSDFLAPNASGIFSPPCWTEVLG